MAMAISRLGQDQSRTVADALLVEIERGLAVHFYLRALIVGSHSEATRNLSDAVHLLCALHSRQPGLVEKALQCCQAGAARDWLDQAADAFDRERLYLVRLAAAVGPQPSTPGAAASEAALAAQRHAVDTLAQSERRGCALGAAIALVGDWQSVRPMLDRVADRTGIEVPRFTLPRLDRISGALEVLDGESISPQRAIQFGAEQLLAQHRGLFDLLEVRASARSASS